MPEAAPDGQYWAFLREYDFPPTVPVIKYLVLSAPRTGSTMLCSALTKSRCAGRPLEYFNGKALDAFRAMTGSRSLNAYLEFLVYRRTTPNGVFGMKLHFEQFMQLFGAKALSTTGIEFLKLFDKFVFIHRRDKIKQAISMLIAGSGGLWNQHHSAVVDKGLRQFEPRDYEAIASNIAKALNEENGWRDLIANHRLDTHAIAYEDMVANPTERIGEVMAFMGIRVPSADSIQPTTVRLSSDGHQAAKANFLKAIGGDKE